jgi:hypothetical protein
LPIATQKCAVLHVGPGNDRANYFLDGVVMPSVDSMRDLGVVCTSDLRFSTHCNIIVATAFRRLAIVRRCFGSGNTQTNIWAFKVYVRPLLEFASQVWSPHLLTDVDHVESVQRFFTKRLPGMWNVPYGARLGRTGLVSLELRRLWADLALVYLILHGLLRVDLPFFGLSLVTNTRGHSLKCDHQAFRLNCRRSFFAVRITRVWNVLPESVISAPSLVVFKQRLRVFSLDRFLLRNAHVAVLADRFS